MLDKLVIAARRQEASDLHLEPGLPPTVRVHGRLRPMGEPVSAAALLAAARRVVPSEVWGEFLARRSFDAARVIAGVPCRVNVLQSSRGVGLAIRLLATTVPTLAELNLHPDLAELVRRRHGLVLVSGATGSGKSSTLAALVQTINLERPAHIITIEQPVEYTLRPARAFVRQREVGRDTPSFEQALVDALREDPDVIVVGEMRTTEIIRLTLGAAETGHLVLATLHAATPAEALQRIVTAFPAEMQSGVRAQLADSLVAVICQTLEHRHGWPLRVPECEVLVANHAVRANVRDGQLFKLQSALETGAEHGMFSRARYRAWLDQRGHFHVPQVREDAPVEPAAPPGPAAALPPLSSVTTSESALREPIHPRVGEPGASVVQRSKAAPSHVIEIDGDDSLDAVIAELEQRR
jgi:twitching motility protein PilT